MSSRKYISPFFLHVHNIMYDQIFSHQYIQPIWLLFAYSPNKRARLRASGGRTFVLLSEGPSPSNPSTQFLKWHMQVLYIG